MIYLEVSEKRNHVIKTSVIITTKKITDERSDKIISNRITKLHCFCFRRSFKIDLY